MVNVHVPRPEWVIDRVILSVTVNFINRLFARGNLSSPNNLDARIVSGCAVYWGCSGIDWGRGLPCSNFYLAY